MSEGTWPSVLLRLVDRVPLVLLVLGTALLVLGLTSGITYNNWLPMPEPTARIASGVIGLALLAIGSFWSLRAASALIVAGDYGIRITYPRAGDEVETVDVQGTITRDLAAGYCLRVFRVYPDHGLVPLTMAKIDMATKSWVANRCHIGGRKGEMRAFAAYIVGESGEALVAFHDVAVNIHSETMEQARAAKGAVPKYLPPIAKRTKDMFECAEVRVACK